MQLISFVLNYIQRSDWKKEAQKLINNFLNFSFFQITNALIPFLVLPYVVRVIGVEKFGILSVALAIVYYIQVIVDYGFTISGVQKIASHSSNRSKISEIFFSITFIKTALSIICFIALFFVLVSLKYEKTIILVYLFTFLMIPASVLQSVWFFNGMEEMKYLNYTNFIARILYIIGIFIIIKTEQDFYFVPLINAVTMTIGGMIAIIIIMNRFKLKYKRPTINRIIFHLRDGWYVFMSNMGMNLYRNSNVLILGLVTSDEVVGLYAASERIVKMLQMVFTPITSVFYPFFSRHKAKNPQKSIKLFKIMLLIMGTASFFLSLFIFINANWIIHYFYSSSFTDSILLLRILSIVLVVGVLNYMIGIVFMLNFSMKWEFTKSVILTGVLNVVICYFLASTFFGVGAAISFSVAEIVLFVCLIIHIIKQKKVWRSILV